MSRPGTPSWSLKRRLTGRVLGLVIGGWLLTIVLATLVLDHEINEMFDEELHALVETTALYLDEHKPSQAAQTTSQPIATQQLDDCNRAGTNPEAPQQPIHDRGSLRLITLHGWYPEGWLRCSLP